MRKQGKQSDFVQIGNVIDGVLKSFRSEPNYALTKIWRLWDEVAGETIASNARPAAFKGKLLIVHVISATWIHQLQFLKNDLMAKLNDALGKPLVKEIKFKIGPFK
jgi:predicted nucleic acid-binding Zn ribbon protein